jgi:hypothetical protein
MQPIFLAYGEGHFASTATEIAFSLFLVVLFCVFLGFYAAKTYPSDRP